MHEQSETIQANGRWYNVYGRKTKRAGQALAPVHEFEKESYDTMEEAVGAAIRRSQLHRDDHDDEPRPRPKMKKGSLLYGE